jgi:hypothetical protein
MDQYKRARDEQALRQLQRRLAEDRRRQADERPPNPNDDKRRESLL